MTETKTLRDTANAVAAFVGRLGAGDVAELRRLDPACAGGPAFWKVASGPLADEFDGLEDARLDARERSWAAVLRSYALLGGLLRTKEPLGRAFIDAKVQELRFERLLRARGEALEDHLRRVCHQLAAAAVPCDPADLALLVLSDGRRDRETVRRQIARDYYRQLNRKENRS